LRRDPLLNQAYEHLRAVANGPDGVADAFVPHAEDDLPTFVPLRPVDGPPVRRSLSPSQFPDEPS
jgi:hypothetical protein